jgi:diaminohydroxyphosphoribosylaminopyrimidine deaminase/5-amino-6-(5-phosphoribosylamino)uracil reductase
MADEVISAMELDLRSGDATTRSSSVGIFAPFQAAPADRPFVVAQLGLSLDGRIATPTGESRGINGDAALDHLHRIRAEVDAVVVGAGTIVADDPQLNVRRATGRNPARVVIDPSGRIGPGGKWLARDGAKLLLVSAAGHSPYGAELVRLPLDNGIIPPRAIIAALFERGLRRILIEGGAKTISAFMDAGCVDRLHLLMAPVILGSGKMGLDLAPISGMHQALRPKTSVYVLPGGEVVFDCDMRACETAL